MALFLDISTKISKIFNLKFCIFSKNFLFFFLRKKCFFKKKKKFFWKNTKFLFLSQLAQACRRPQKHTKRWIWEFKKMLKRKQNKYFIQRKKTGQKNCTFFFKNVAKNAWKCVLGKINGCYRKKVSFRASAEKNGAFFLFKAWWVFFRFCCYTRFA